MRTKKEICYHCGQEIDRNIYIKHMKKVMTKNGMPNFAKLLTLIEKSPNQA